MAHDWKSVEIGPVALRDVIAALHADHAFSANYASVDILECGRVGLKASHLAALESAPDSLPKILYDVMADHGRVTFSERINAVLAGLKKLPFADKITVFGSLARGRITPGDVDIHVAEADAGGGQDRLLAIAARYYGLLDPFVTRADGRLVVRDDEASSWVGARRVGEMRDAIRTDGRSLADIQPVPVGESEIVAAIEAALNPPPALAL